MCFRQFPSKTGEGSTVTKPWSLAILGMSKAIKLSDFVWQGPSLCCFKPAKNKFLVKPGHF